VALGELRGSERATANRSPVSLIQALDWLVASVSEPEPPPPAPEVQPLQPVQFGAYVGQN
jgi:hypothetical protein